MRRRILLGHVSGIPVQVDYRWFAIILLLTWLVESSIPGSVVSFPIGRYFLSFISVLIFFGTLFLHELAHASAARREGISVLEIFMHPFGGVARLRREPETPGAELRIAIAGPLASFAIAVVFLALFSVSSWQGTNVLSPLLFILFLLNLLLGIFNLFPGFPLDGGRVLRAILWKRGMRFSEATILTGKFGQVIAFAMIFFGIAIIGFNRDLFMGVWTILVGVFLLDSATGFIRGVNRFDDLIVENVMELPVALDPESSIMECVDKVIPFHRHTIFPVARRRELFGFFLLADVKEKLPRTEWPETKVREIMRPIREDLFIDSNRPVSEARELLQINELGVLGVVDKDAKLVGFLQRGRIRRRN